MIPKYRFFDTKENKMHVVDSLYTFKSFGGKDITIATEDIDLSEWRSYSDGVLMQHTGLKDKKGVEIFEGDVLKVFIFDGKGPHAKVIFKNGLFGIEDDMFGYGYDKGLYTLDQIISIRDAEVIGNKYEHPHLLEGDNE